MTSADDASTKPDENSWQLDLVAQVPGVRHVVVLSADGLVRVRTDHTERDVAETLAATCAGLTSLGSGVSRSFGDGTDPWQVMVEFSQGFLFVRGAGDGSRLAVVTEQTVDAVLVAQQMQAQVLMIGEHTMSTPAR